MQHNHTTRGTCAARAVPARRLEMLQAPRVSPSEAGHRDRCSEYQKIFYLLSVLCVFFYGALGRAF